MAPLNRPGAAGRSGRIGPRATGSARCDREWFARMLEALRQAEGQADWERIFEDLIRREQAPALKVVK